MYNSAVRCIVEFTGHLLSDRDTTSSTGMGAGGNGNNQWECEENGNKGRLNLRSGMGMGMNRWECEENGTKTRLNLGSGMEMGMNRWELEGMGLKKTFPLISISVAATKKPDAERQTLDTHIQKLPEYVCSKFLYWLKDVRKFELTW